MELIPLEELMPQISRADVYQRTLIYFPIIHSQKDMGGLSASVRKVTLQKLGVKEWKRKINLVDQFWTDIENAIQGLTLPDEKIRLYQDGLPICGREAEIVRELAQKGSPNHRLLLRLMEKGAILMGTESSALLIEEYKSVKKILESGDVREAIRIESNQKSVSDALLEKRDAFIAKQIDATLLAGETGIIFLGILHKMEGRLPKDIHVIYPIGRPVYQRGT